MVRCFRIIEGRIGVSNTALNLGRILCDMEAKGEYYSTIKKELISQGYQDHLFLPYDGLARGTGFSPVSIPEFWDEIEQDPNLSQKDAQEISKAVGDSRAYPAEYLLLAQYELRAMNNLQKCRTILKKWIDTGEDTAVARVFYADSLKYHKPNFKKIKDLLFPVTMNFEQHAPIRHKAALMLLPIALIEGNKDLVISLIESHFMEDTPLAIMAISYYSCSSKEDILKYCNKIMKKRHDYYIENGADPKMHEWSLCGTPDYSLARSIVKWIEDPEKFMSEITGRKERSYITSGFVFYKGDKQALNHLLDQDDLENKGIQHSSLLKLLITRKLPPKNDEFANDQLLYLPCANIGLSATPGLIALKIRNKMYLRLSDALINTDKENIQWFHDELSCYLDTYDLQEDFLRRSANTDAFDIFDSVASTDLWNWFYSNFLREFPSDNYEQANLVKAVCKKFYDNDCSNLEALFLHAYFESKPDLAIRIYLKLLDHEYSQAACHYNLAILYSKNGDNKSALHHAKENRLQDSSLNINDEFIAKVKSSLEEKEQTEAVLSSKRFQGIYSADPESIPLYHLFGLTLFCDRHFNFNGQNKDIRESLTGLFQTDDIATDWLSDLINANVFRVDTDSLHCLNIDENHEIKITNLQGLKIHLNLIDSQSSFNQSEIIHSTLESVLQDYSVKEVFDNLYDYLAADLIDHIEATADYFNVDISSSKKLQSTVKHCLMLHDIKKCYNLAYRALQDAAGLIQSKKFTKTHAVNTAFRLMRSQATRAVLDEWTLWDYRKMGGNSNQSLISINAANLFLELKVHGYYRENIELLELI